MYFFTVIQTVFIENILPKKWGLFVINTCFTKSEIALMCVSKCTHLFEHITYPCRYFIYVLIIICLNIFNIKLWELYNFEPSHGNINNHNAGKHNTPLKYSGTWLLLCYWLYMWTYQTYMHQLTWFNSFNFIEGQIPILPLMVFNFWHNLHILSFRYSCVERTFL